MGLMDKVKAQAEVGLAKASEVGKTGLAKANEASKTGQAKLDAAQAKHKADGLLHDLGAAVYAERTDRGTDQLTADVERIVSELEEYEAEYGPIVP
jgi:hypothetical protein